MTTGDRETRAPLILLRFRLLAALLLMAHLTALGCSRSPMAVPVPELDANASASEVLQTYDTDGDGLLDAEELASCVGLADKVAQYDSSGDGKMSPDELSSRIRSWINDGLGMTSVPCLVTLDGRPLSGAAVTFEPVDFLGKDVLLTARGVTGPDGRCGMTVDPAELPKELSRIMGVQPGMYKIVITHDSEKIPAQYNDQTTLSVEVSQKAIGPEGIRLHLKRK